MKQLIVRSVDTELHAALKREARRRGISVNRYVLRVLAEAVGLPQALRQQEVYHDLDHLAGTWTAEQADEFNRFLAEQRQVDRSYNVTIP